MSDRPILFSGEMVRAILEGRKTQTRRVVKPQPAGDDLRIFDSAYDWLFGDDGKAWGLTAGDHGYEETSIRQPFGQPRYEPPMAVELCPGDRLWVRETHWTDERDPTGCVIYSADDARHHKYRRRERVEQCDREITNEYLRKHRFWRQRPSIFMPRWASRLTLEITDVRVERLNSISSEDAIAEGLARISKDAGRTWKYGIPDRDGLPGSDDDGMDWCDWSTDPRSAFATLWDSINEKRGYGWTVNPWVWVIQFKRVEHPAEKQGGRT